MELEFVNTVWSLLPAVVAIVLALVTKETYTSLFVGIIVGGLLYKSFAPVGTLNVIINKGFIPAVSDNAGIFIFLVILGIMVAMINSAGGAAAFGSWAAKHIKGRVGAQLATFILGVLIFIDDYFNCLTVGTIMRPLTDGKRISRAKLAFIIDATAAPICMIAPVSSWAAAVSGVAADLNVNGIQLFISAIPFNFYSILMIVFVVVNSLAGFEYGPMAKAELAAYRDGELGSLGNDETVENSRANLLDMLIPIIVLIVCCIVGMMYVGGFWKEGTEFCGDLIAAFGNTDAFVALPWGSLIAIVFTFFYLLIRRVSTFKEITATFVTGFNAMVPAILVLTFAVTLKNMTSLLGADVFVANAVAGCASGLMNFLPAVIFLVAAFLAFATGTSWGTFGILIPIVLPIFSADSTLLTIGISACLAGAVCGDHCSPISDTTVMASAGANMNHIEHVQTQLPYVITVAVISFVSFIAAGLSQNVFISYIVAAICLAAAMIVLRKTIGRKIVDAPKKKAEPAAK